MGSETRTARRALRTMSPQVLSLFLAVLFLLVCVRPAGAQDVVRVFYAGPEDGVRQALALAADPALRSHPRFEFVTDPAQADVFVLNGEAPDGEGIAARVRDGAGLLLILGPRLSAQAVSDLLGVPLSLASQDTPLSLVGAPGSADPVATEIPWTSAPQVRERFTLLSSSADLLPLVLGFEDEGLVLGVRQVGAGRVYVLTPFLDDANPQFQEWAYFHYLVYDLTTRAAGRSPLPFADYPASPLPHASERMVMFALLALLLTGAVVAFVLVRRYSLAHPEALDALVADRRRYATREVGTDWEEIGFHRPLGGFLLALMLGLVLFIPLIVYQNLILPVYILPSAQALGLWGRVTQFFQVAWWFFDMGTSAALIKYLAQYRVEEPRKGIQYVQLFVWWQALSGAVQVALVIALSSTVVVRSAYALYAWSVIIHALIQLPGFYQVFRHALTGLQRFDYAQVLDLGLALIFPILTQPLIVALMVAWGRAHPVFGGAMGGLLGLGLAAYAAEALTFCVGLWLYRRLGYAARVLFMAHFDWEVIRSGFQFGVFDMLASVAWTLGQAAEIWITQVRLINYAEIWGNWGLAQNFIFAFQVLQTLYSNLMPSISEAISHGRRLLSQYYSVQAYRYGGIISAFIGAVLLAVADRFILGASGPEFVRAAAYAIPLIVWGAIQYPSWVGDTVQLAANRPYLKSALVAGEQAIRIVLAWLLMERFQINALIIAYFIGLLTKGIVAYVVNHRFCFPQRFYAWSSLAAPLLAGAAHYGILRWVTGFIWQGDQVTSVLIFLVGILISFPLFMFLYGLFGGWDDAALAELRRAVELSSFMRPLSWLLWASTTLGARVSPLHGRFPIAIRAAALEEARALSEERVRL